VQPSRTAAARDEPARVRSVEEERRGADVPEEAGRMTPAARAEAQRILDGAARRLLAARLEAQTLGAAPGGDRDPLEDGTDKASALVEREQIPVRPGVNDEGGVEGA
jgi:hypothetical protein